MQPRRKLTSMLTAGYLFIIRDEENFAEKATISFTIAKVILAAALLFVLLFGFSMLLATTILSRWLDPRTEFLQTNRALIELEAKVDSLTEASARKDKYLLSLRNILEGRSDFSLLDSVVKTEENKDALHALSAISPVEEKFRKSFEKEDIELSVKGNPVREKLQDQFFFTPLSGIISRKFDSRDRHYGVDIVAKANEPIKCVADGTVIVSSWTQDSGHVIAVQHKNQVVSFYKHNSVLLKKVGEVVRTGDILAIIGNSGEYTDGPHLHFELWYDGNPVNPQDVIYF